MPCPLRFVLAGASAALAAWLFLSSGDPLDTQTQRRHSQVSRRCNACGARASVLRWDTRLFLDRLPQLSASRTEVPPADAAG